MESAALKVVASAKVLVVVMVGVVVSFVASTAVSQYVDNRSAQQTADIVGNAVPSIQVLALVRGDLRNIDRVISRPSVSPGDHPAKTILENRRNIDTALATYLALPFFPGEQKMFAPVPGLLRELDLDLAGADAGLDPTELAKARSTIDAIDAALQRIVTYDASQGQRLGLEIAQARSRSRSIVWLLDAASVLLATGAMALAFRQHRRALRAWDHHHAATQRHVTELRTQVDELGQFAGRVAHDVRSPLQAAVMAVDTLRLGAGNPAVAQSLLQHGMNALRRMTVLVDGLFEFARAGGRPVDGATADLRAVIEDVMTGVAPDAEAHRIELCSQLPVAAQVACSPGVLTSIVANLTRNAIRHMGDALERRVDVRAASIGTSCRIEVRDTGPGIPPGEERRIFEPHVQLGGASGGIGLGLATVDRLVRSHGGRVGVVSPAAGGALFWVELPGA